MAVFSRLLISLIGLASLLAVWSANVRADVGGLFLCIASFAFVAAWKKSRLWLTATILLVGSALLGRFVSLGIDGYSAHVGSPMLVEMVVIAILALAYWSWGKKPEGL
jgi:hypothetical protein